MRRHFLQKELPYYTFHLLEKFSDRLGHAVFTRQGGVSQSPYDSLNVRFEIGDNAESVHKNRTTITHALKITNKKLVSANQTHSKNVMVLGNNIDQCKTQNYSSQNAKNLLRDSFDNIDAFITNEAGFAPMIQVADCQGIIMYDPQEHVLAVIHAGWKGLAQNISGEVLSLMKKSFGVKSQNILAGISPSLGPCCAFFTDPEEELPLSFRPYIDKEKRVNLWAYSQNQLENLGISTEHIENARICTNCENGRRNQIERGHSGSPHFFSFRADRGITGRFGVMAWLEDLKASM